MKSRMTINRMRCAVCIVSMCLALAGCAGRPAAPTPPTADGTIRTAAGAPLLFTAPVNLDVGAVTFLLTDGGLRLIVLDDTLRAFSIQPDVASSSAGDALLIVQTPPQIEAVMHVNGVVTTLSGTMALSVSRSPQLELIVWEGVAVVAAFGEVQVVHAGTMVSIPLDAENNFQARAVASFPQSADLPLSEAQRALLPRSLALPTVAPTAAVNREQGGACTPEPRWTGRYIVLRGDSLSQIATRFGLTLPELQTGNCLANPNRLDIGQVLVVPFSLTPASPYPTATPPNPDTIGLRADPERIRRGECSSIVWQAEDVQSLLFDSQPAAPAGVQTVCPATTTTYTVLVIDAAGRQTIYTVAVTVIEE